MSIEAIKLALEALEDATKHIFLGDKNGVEANIRAHKQCESLRQAIAETEKQEPVAWWVPKAEQFCLQNPSGERPFAKAWEPLYTTPQQRKPLTDEQIKRIWESLPFCNGAWETFAREIEAVHGIKE